MDVHTLFSFISCLGKHHESHDFLNERLDTHSAWYQTLAGHWMLFVIDERMQKMFLTVSHLQLQQMRDMWSVFVLCSRKTPAKYAQWIRWKAAYLQHVSLSHKQLWKSKVCTKWIPHMLNEDQHTVCVLLATAHFQQWKRKGAIFLSRILTVDKPLLLSCYIISLRPKYLPQHPIIEHPRSTPLPEPEGWSSTLIQHKKQNYSSVYINLCIFG